MKNPAYVLGACFLLLVIIYLWFTGLEYFILVDIKENEKPALVLVKLICGCIGFTFLFYQLLKLLKMIYDKSGDVYYSIGWHWQRRRLKKKRMPISDKTNNTMTNKEELAHKIIQRIDYLTEDFKNNIIVSDKNKEKLIELIEQINIDEYYPKNISKVKLDCIIMLKGEVKNLNMPLLCIHLYSLRGLLL